VSEERQDSDSFSFDFSFSRKFLFMHDIFLFMHDSNTQAIPLARRDVIAERLAQGQTVVASTLATEFNVSEDAVRRDLRALAAEGLCRRVYGGALPIAAAAKPMLTRLDEGRAFKEALARCAAATIQPGELVFLDSGSANLALTEFLPGASGLTVATNAIDIAAAVLKRTDLKLIMVGGMVDDTVGGCVDATAVLAVSQMNIDRCFIGACSVSAEQGVCAVEMADATFKRAVVAASRCTFVLVTNDKFEMHAPHRVASVQQISRLVLESSAPSAVLASLAQAGASVLQADPV
jgi:DeoR/GlpR family transcriptional regulator of sugar metabolism